MIVVGRRGYSKDLSQTNIQQKCPHCHNDVTYKATESGTKFTLFWVPLFSFNKSYRVICPICQYGYNIDKKELDNYTTHPL